MICKAGFQLVSGTCWKPAIRSSNRMESASRDPCCRFSRLSGKTGGTSRIRRASNLCLLVTGTWFRTYPRTGRSRTSNRGSRIRSKKNRIHSALFEKTMQGNKFCFGKLSFCPRRNIARTSGRPLCSSSPGSQTMKTHRWSFRVLSFLSLLLGMALPAAAARRRLRKRRRPMPRWWRTRSARRCRTAAMPMPSRPSTRRLAGQRRPARLPALSQRPGPAPRRQVRRGHRRLRPARQGIAQEPLGTPGTLCQGRRRWPAKAISAAPS